MKYVAVAAGLFGQSCLLGASQEQRGPRLLVLLTVAVGRLRSLNQALSAREGECQQTRQAKVQERLGSPGVTGARA